MKLHPDKYRGEVNLHEQSNKSHKQKSSVLKIFKLMWYMVTNVVFRIEARKKKRLKSYKAVCQHYTRVSLLEEVFTSTVFCYVA